MSGIHSKAIELVAKELAQLEAQIKDIREGIPDWDTNPANAELASWLEAADWDVFDLKRSLRLLEREAGQRHSN